MTDRTPPSASVLRDGWGAVLRPWWCGEVPTSPQSFSNSAGVHTSLPLALLHARGHRFESYSGPPLFAHLVFSRRLSRDSVALNPQRRDGGRLARSHRHHGSNGATVTSAARATARTLLPPSHRGESLRLKLRRNIVALKTRRFERELSGAVEVVATGFELRHHE